MGTGTRGGTDSESPRLVVVSHKGAIIGQRVKEERCWQVAQGLLGEAPGESAKAIRLMRALSKTAGVVLPRVFEGGAGSALAGGGVNGTPYVPGARASVARGQAPIPGNRSFVAHSARKGASKRATERQSDETTHIRKPCKGAKIYRCSVGNGGGRRCKWPGDCFAKKQAGQVSGMRVSPVGVVSDLGHIAIIHTMLFEHR